MENNENNFNAQNNGQSNNVNMNQSYNNENNFNQQQNGQQGNFNQQFNNFNNQVKSEVDSGKFMAILSYFGILALIPYLSEKNNSFVVFHAKQGMNLFILGIIAFFGASIFGVFLSMRFLLVGLVEMALFVFAIIGIVYAAQGEKKELPLIGSIKIIK